MAQRTKTAYTPEQHCKSESEEKSKEKCHDDAGASEAFAHTHGESFRSWFRCACARGAF